MLALAVLVVPKTHQDTSIGAADLHANPSAEVAVSARAVAVADPKSAESLHCLALNVYHEARSEPLEGQLAVAAVTLNRVASESFPDSVCRVVKQGGERRNRCQFSWWCDGKSDEPTNQAEWSEVNDLANNFLARRPQDPTDGALFYHATSIQRPWGRHLTAQIGNHIFYR